MAQWWKRFIHGQLCQRPHPLNHLLDGPKLRKTRLEQGLPLNQLAALTGRVIPARQLGEYEAGSRSCDPPRMMLPSMALGVRPPSARRRPSWSICVIGRGWPPMGPPTDSGCLSR